jgi:hypothetical protein
MGKETNGETEPQKIFVSVPNEPTVTLKGLQLTDSISELKAKIRLERLWLTSIRCWRSDSALPGFEGGDTSAHYGIQYLCTIQLPSGLRGGLATRETCAASNVHTERLVPQAAASARRPLEARAPRSP